MQSQGKSSNKLDLLVLGEGFEEEVIVSNEFVVLYPPLHTLACFLGVFL